jgi:hypothetical protein
MLSPAFALSVFSFACLPLCAATAPWVWALRVLAMSLCVSAIFEHALSRVVMKPLKQAIDELYEALTKDNSTPALEAQLAGIRKASVQIDGAIKVGNVFAILVIPPTIACAWWPLMTSIVVTYAVPGVGGVVATVQALALARSSFLSLAALARTSKARNAAVRDATGTNTSLRTRAPGLAAAVHPQ